MPDAARQSEDDQQAADETEGKPLGLEERIRTGIEDDILLGRLAPGDRLDERALAQRYHVSRTPVREALRHLASEGLIEIRPRQGTVVTRIGVGRLMQMFEMMNILEAQCARLAARRMSPAQRADLDAVQKKAAKAVADEDLPAFNECNWQFHQAIFNGSQNPFLAEQARKLRLRLHPYRCFLLMTQGRMLRSHKDHEEILNALLAGDEDRAFEAMSQHLGIDADRLADFLAALPP